MPTHPAVTRQQARISGGTENVNPTDTLSAPAYYSQNQAIQGVSAYGPLRKSLAIHVEGAAGSNAGVNQIVTQDMFVKQACDDAVKEGFLTKVGGLV